MTARKAYLEWMRVIAIFLVIFNHLPGYTLFTAASGPAQGALMFLSMLTRINIPLFLMISGAVLLPRQEDYRTVLRRRVSRMAAVIVLFTLAIYAAHAFYYIRVKGQPFDFSFRSYIYGLLTTRVYGADSYWFLYLYLNYLLMLPFLQRCAKGMGRQDFGALLILRALLRTVLPVLNLAFGKIGLPNLSANWYLTLPLALGDAFFYPLIGYYLDSCVDIARLSRAKTALLALAGAACLGVSCLCTYLRAGQTGSVSEDYVQLLDYAAAMAAFLLIKRLTTVTLPRLCQGRPARWVCGLGALTFGIYLLDPFLKLLVWGPFNRLASSFLPVLPVSLLWCLLSMAAGGAITWVLRRIPGLRRLL